KVTPAHMAAMEQLLDGSRAQSSAHVMVIGGEALYWDRLEFWRRHAPDTRLINEYGPTETVVGCCIYEISGDAMTGGVPIGHPISNTKIYVLDQEYRPEAVGIQGEIYIGGEGVGRGYRGRPD